MRITGVQTDYTVGGEPMTQRVMLLFKTSLIAKLDVEDAVAKKGLVVAGKYETLSDLMRADHDTPVDVLICEMSCIVGLNEDQVRDLAGRFEAVLVIASEQVIHLPKLSANIIVLQAPYREADMAAALAECGL